MYDEHSPGLPRALRYDLRLPAGGATALIASTLPTLPKWHGYSFLVTVGVGSLVMQGIALIINNLDPRRRYPTFWF